MRKVPLIPILLAAGLALALAFARSSLEHAPEPPTAPGHAAHDLEHADHDLEHADHDHEHADHDHEHAAHDLEHADHAHGDHADHAGHADHDQAAEPGVRLLVASLDAPELLVVDPSDGAVLGRFTTPGPGRAFPLPDARYAAVLHREANRVTIVHGGFTVVDHGDHADLLEGPPYVLATLNLGPLPSQFTAGGDHLAVSLAGDGTVAWLDARLFGITLDFVQIPGVAEAEVALAFVADHLLLGGAAMEGVRVHDRDGSVVTTIDGCPGLRGSAIAGDGAAFGCADGVLWVEDVRGAFQGRKLRAPTGGRVTHLVAHPEGAYVAGAFAGEIGLIDPLAGTFASVALGAPPVALAFADAGLTLLVVAESGVLHALDAATGAELASLDLSIPAVAPTASIAITVVGEHAYVVDPETSRLITVDLHAFAVLATHTLDVRPGSVAAFAIPGALRH